MADKTLDTKGLNCPLPILKTKKALQDIPIGGTLEVLATDFGAVDEVNGIHHVRDDTGMVGDDADAVAYLQLGSAVEHFDGRMLLRQALDEEPVMRRERGID